MVQGARPASRESTNTAKKSVLTSIDGTCLCGRIRECASCSSLTRQDPALEINTAGNSGAYTKRAEQPIVDSIFRGEEAGGYYLIVGPKGTGKNTMLLE